jgi:hypothetical protein
MTENGTPPIVSLSKYIKTSDERIATKMNEKKYEYIRLEAIAYLLIG